MDRWTGHISRDRISEEGVKMSGWRKIALIPVSILFITSAFAFENDEVMDELDEDTLILPFACQHATSKQIAEIVSGNAKYDSFMRECWNATGGSRWCEQLTRPNPASRATFICTYGSNLPHRLIHPDHATWSNAFKAVRFVQELEKKGIRVEEIYNWWRPEPYNKNVGGAHGRHPFGTSVDVRFVTLHDMELAFKKLCLWRKQGAIRAVGYYGSTGLHFGIGDHTANTWGKSCPN